MPDIKKPAKIRSIRGYLRWVEELGGSRRIYRGLAGRNWKANSSAERRIFPGGWEKEGIPPTDEVLRYTERLLADVRRSDFHISENQSLSDLRILAKLQHDQAATCFIDFTYDPLIALWFACAPSDSASNKNGKIISVDAEDIDKFSEIPDGELGEDIKHFFAEKDKPWKWQPPMDLNKRVPVQKSVFIFGRADIAASDYEEVLVDEGAKKTILSILSKKYGISEEMLFPDYPGFVRLNASNRDYQLSVEYYFRLGVIAHQKGDYDASTANYDRSIELDGKNAAIYNNRGIIYGKMGEYNKANKDFSKAIELKTNYAKAYNNRGVTFKNIGDYDKAIEDYNEAIRLEPDYADAYNNRGTAYKSIGDHDKAIEDYNEAIRLKPNDADAYYNRGIIYKDMGDYVKAIEDYREAIRLNPNHAKAYNNRGIAYGNIGKHDKAIEDFDEAIRLKPDHADAYYNRGLAKQKSGDKEGAQADFDEADRLRKIQESPDGNSNK